MPFISGFVGWVTNVIALKMTFYPLEFWGIPIKQWENQPFGLIGWQGIIPCKAAVMAAKSCDLMTEKLIDIREVFNRMDPARFADVMEPGMLQMMDVIIHDVMHAHLRSIWDTLPWTVKDEVVIKSLEESPQMLTELMQDMKDDIEEVYDIKHMVVTKMTTRKELLNRIFQDCGVDEFIFIERSGFYFGFLFGCIQAVIWWFYQGSWVLPVGGFIVGYATNALALKIIFQPVDPVYCCGFRFQGLFLQRQEEVSKVFAKMTAEEVLNSPSMWDAILHGPRMENFMALLDRHTHRFLDGMLGAMRPLVVMYLGAEKFHAMKEDIAASIMMELPKHLHLSYAYTERAFDIEATIRDAMANLSSRDFEGVLHPVFEEDEIKLILVGAALGTAVGFFQLAVLFSG